MTRRRSRRSARPIRGRAGIDHETPIAELFEDQLACADMVVVSKTDRMDGAALDRVLGEVARPGAAPACRFVASRAEGLAPDVLLGLGIAAEDDVAARAAPHHDAEGEDHDHDEFESFAADAGRGRRGRRPSPRGWPRRSGRTTSCASKGFAAVAGRPMRLVVQAVGPRVETHYDRPFGAEPRQTRLVVIGEAGLDRKAIGAAIEAAIGAARVAAHRGGGRGRGRAMSAVMAPDPAAVELRRDDGLGPDALAMIAESEAELSALYPARGALRLLAGAAVEAGRRVPDGASGRPRRRLRRHGALHRAGRRLWRAEAHLRRPAQRAGGGSPGRSSAAWRRKRAPAGCR